MNNVHVCIIYRLHYIVFIHKRKLEILQPTHKVKVPTEIINFKVINYSEKRKINKNLQPP